MATTVFLVSTAFGGDAVKKEQQLLQGEWKLIKLTEKGREAEDAPKHVNKVTFAGSKLTISMTNPDGKSDVKSATLTLMPQKSPKAIDIVPDEGPEKGQVSPGIYELKGDKLRICAVDGRKSKDRPTEFSSTEANGTVILEFERVKK
jgi:uncharacterized protein (TIGR03067 family)